MLARWYLLLGQFSVTFEYRPGSQHANADGISRQCGQCRRPDCPVSATDLLAADADTQSLLVDQLFASSEMGDSMDSDLSGETWVASALLEELIVDLPTAGSDIDLVAASREDNTLHTVVGGIWKCSAMAGLCRPFSRTTLLATTSRKSDYRLGGSSLASSVAPVRGVTVSDSSSRTPGPDSTVS